MDRPYYIATSNPGKLRDFATAAASRGVTILPLPGLATIAPPPEDEPTFAANAEAKARYYSQMLPEAIVLADDSGLEVDALQGAPGVRSARYAADSGENFPPELTTDQQNNLHLLGQLRGVEEPRRTGRYVCVLAAARDGRVVLTAQGFVEGRILPSPRGTGGFGYDPLFYLPALERTMAEIDLETKDGISHRGRALRELLERIPSVLP